MQQSFDLDKHVSKLSTILNHLHAENAHYCDNNPVLFGNGNQQTFLPIPINKKIFGKQALLTAIAKSKGFTTYKSFKESNEKTLPIDLINGIYLLNPYPLSPMLSLKWKHICDHIVKSLKYLSEEINIDLETLQNFKHHEESKYLSYSNQSLFTTYSPMPIEGPITYQYVYDKEPLSTPSFVDDNFCLFHIAQSIYITALKLPLESMKNKDSRFHTKKIVDQMMVNGMDTDLPTDHIKNKSFLSKSFTLADCLNKPLWSIDKTDDFFYNINHILENSFQCHLNIEGPYNKPLELKLSVEFDDTNSTAYSIQNKLQVLKKRYNTHMSVMEAALRLKPIYEQDTNIYVAKRFAELCNSHKIKSDELRYAICQTLKTNKSATANELQLKGSKLFWLNHIMDLKWGSLDHYSGSIENIMQQLDEDLRFHITPYIESNTNAPYEYHFKLKREDLNILTRNNGYVPKGITITSDEALPYNYIMMMCHAELSKLNGHEEYRIGDSHQYFAKQLNSDEFIHLSIKPSKTQVSGSIIVPFDVRATVLCAEIHTHLHYFKGEPKLGLMDGLSVDLTLITSLIDTELNEGFNTYGAVEFNQVPFTYLPGLGDLIANEAEGKLLNKPTVKNSLKDAYQHTISMMEEDNIYSSLIENFAHHYINHGTETSRHCDSTYTTDGEKYYAHEKYQNGDFTKYANA